MSIAAARLRVDVDANTKAAEGALGKFSENLKKPAKGFSMAKAAALSFAGGAAVAFGSKIIMAASDLNEEVSKSATVFGAATPALKTVTTAVDDLAKKFGLNKTEMTAAASGFGLLGQAVGITGAPLAKMSTGLTQLAADAMSFYNVPMDQALADIKSGLVGQSEPLLKYGVILNETAVKAEAVRLGLVKTGQTLTENDKVTARTSLITKGFSKASGDLARTQGSVANRLREVTNRAKNAAAELGTALLPAASAALGGLLELSGGIKNNLGPAFDNAKRAWGQLMDGFTGKKPPVGIFGAIGAEAASLAAQVKPVLEDLVAKAKTAGTDLIANIATGMKTGNWAALGASLRDGLTTALNAVAQGSVALFAALGRMIQAVPWGDLAMQIGRQVPTMLLGLVVGILNFDLGSVLKTLKDHWFEVLIGIISIAFAPARFIGKLGTILNKIPFVGSLLKWGLDALVKFSKGLVSGIGKLFSTFAKGFFDGIASRFPVIASRFGGALTNLASRLLIGYVRIWISAAQLPLKLGEAILRGVGAVGGAAGRLVGGLLRPLLAGAGRALSAGARIISFLMRPFSNIGGKLVSAGASLIRGFISGIGSMIGSVKSTLGNLTNSLTSWKGPPAKDAMLLHRSGQLVMTGFRRGLESKYGSIQASLGAYTKRLAEVKVRLKAFEDIGKSIGRAFTAGITGTRGSIESAMNTLTDKITARSTQLGKRVVSVLTREISWARGRLTALADKISDIEARKSDFGSVSASVTGTGNIAGLGATTKADGSSGPATSDGIVSDLKAKVAAAKEFAAQLATLKGQGLNAQSLSDLVNAGVEAGGATAKALVAGGKQAVAQVNALTKQLVGVSYKVADVGSKAMFSAGKAAAEGLARGFAAQEAVLRQEMVKIAKILEAEIANTLKRARPKVPAPPRPAPRRPTATASRPAGSARASGAPRARVVNVNVVNHNPVAQPASVTTNRALDHVRVLGL